MTGKRRAADGTRTLDAVTHIGTASLYAFVRNGYRDDAEAFPDALSFLQTIFLHIYLQRFGYTK